MRPFYGGRRQRGVALIIALILVALAAILATKLTFDGWLERRRTIAIIATEQACADCLVPKDLMRGILGKTLGVASDAIDLTYPAD